MANLFGWEMIFKSVKLDMKKDSDYIVAFAHWFLVQRANLRCLGNGKDMRLRSNEVGSEMLPTDWNRNDKTYAMKYVLNDNVYVLMGTVSEDSFIMNFLSANKLELSNVSFHTETTAACIKTTKSVINTELQGIIDRFTEELLNPVFESNAKAAETQTVDQPPPPRSPPCARLPDPDDYPHPLQMPSRRDRDREQIFGVGRRDLDPFAVGGGGMIFDPPRNFPPVFPGGRRDEQRIPPGARFDPFGPPPANLGRPNHDHFRPPQFDQANNNDDMFM